jgi:hypothetical protein
MFPSPLHKTHGPTHMVYGHLTTHFMGANEQPCHASTLR